MIIVELNLKQFPVLLVNIGQRNHLMFIHIQLMNIQTRELVIIIIAEILAVIQMLIVLGAILLMQIKDGNTVLVRQVFIKYTEHNHYLPNSYISNSNTLYR